MDDKEGIPSKPDVNEEWIREVVNRIDLAFTGSFQWPSPHKDETEPEMCKFTLREEISRPRLVTAGEFSRPIVVSIGPFHRQQKKISISNKVKLMFVYFVNHCYGLKSKDLARYLTKIKNQAARARSCYSKLDLPKRFGVKDDKNGKSSVKEDKVKEDKKDKRFAEMLLVDSYFILFMLTIQIRKRPTGYTLMPIIPTNTAGQLKLFRDDKTKVLDIIFNKDEIAPDLLILDNQIPFFVIEELFKELKSDKPLHEYALEFFETIHPRSAQRCIDENSSPQFLHLLDLFHWSRVPESKYIELSTLPQQLDSIDQTRYTPIAMECRECTIMFEKEKPQQLDSIHWARHTPNATELRESATMFEKKTSGSSLDITFRRRLFKRIIGVLDIPELHIRDYSSFIFHNLIAFEMQSSRRGRCTMAFSAFMRNLLQSEEDVKLLRQSGILASSSLNDSKLVYLFECLSKLTENHQMPSDLSVICHQVISYHNHPVSRFCGGFILRYFPNSVVTLSVFVATLLFVPTLLQTIYTMKSYYQVECSTCYYIV